MSKRSDALKLLRGETPEYVPWYGDLQYWIEYLLSNDIMPDRYIDEDYRAADKTESLYLSAFFVGEGLQQLHEDLGVGFYLQGYFPFDTFIDADKTITQENGRRTTIWHTPYGDLTEIELYDRNSCSCAPLERLVKSHKDLKALRWLYEHTRYEPDYALAEKRVLRVGENGIVVCYLPKSPFQELVALKAGIEAVTYIYMDAEAELRETLEVIEAKHDEAARIAISSPAEVIFSPENLSSDLSGGMFFNKYLSPVYEKWTGWIRDEGKVSMVHLDGALDPLVENLSGVGFDVVEAITPYPVGDLRLEEIRTHTSPKTVLWGGIPGGFFTQILSNNDFDHYVKNAIELFKKDGRFVLGVGDQVSPGASFERVRRVNELVLEYGRYD